MQWVIYALFSAFFAALVAIFGKLGLSGIDSTLATTIRAIVMAIFLVLVSVILNKWQLSGQISFRSFWIIFLSGIFGALSWLFYFLALKEGNVGGVVAVDRMSVVFAFILSILFLGEVATLKSIVGVSLVFLGALIFAI